MSNIIKKYSTIDYAVLKKLDVSPNELAYLDMIYYLSKAGSDWCYKSLQAIATDLNLGKSTIQSMRDRLLKKELITRNQKGYVKTTEAIHLSYSENRGSVRYSYDQLKNRTKFNTHRTKSEQNRTKSGTKNNNRITIRNKDKKLSTNLKDELKKLKPDTYKKLYGNE